jgi:hypothetical protein
LCKWLIREDARQVAAVRKGLVMGTKSSVELVPADGSMRDWAEQLVARSRAEGVELTGADGLLTALMKTVLQTGMEVEMADHQAVSRMIGPGSGLGTRGTGRTRKRFQPRLVTSRSRFRVIVTARLIQ